MLKNISFFLKSHKAVPYVLLFLLCFSYFAWLQNNTGFADPDSFYHAKIVQIMSQEGVVRDFPYLPYTTLKNSFVDHHFLYHLYLAPFVKIFPVLVGVKIGHVLLASLMMLVFYFVLKKLKIYGAFWYALFTLLMQGFVFRVGLIKAQPLSMIFLFLGFYLILKRKYLPLFFLSFFYVWAYGGWFLLLILTFIYIFTESVDAGFHGLQKTWLDRLLNFKKKKLISEIGDKIYNFTIAFLKNALAVKNWQLFLVVFGGLALGLIINPYFPKNLEFFYIHIIKIAFVNYQSVIGVGSEWYPYSSKEFLANTLLPIGLALIALVVFVDYRRKFKMDAKYALAVFLAFVLATLKSRRNIEYLCPFAVLAGAVVFSRAYDLYEVKKSVRDLIKIFKQTFFSDLITKTFFSALMVLVVVVLFYTTPIKVKAELEDGINYNYLKAASDYLINNSQVGDVVLHSSWDEFPMLFYHNNKNYYIAGLDATFMYLYDKDLYQKWVDITQGKRYKEMYEIIKGEFKAKYVLATKKHEAMIKALDNNFFFKKVYSDDEAVIYRVL